MRSKLVKQKPVVISAEIFASDRLTSLTRAGEILEREPLAERQDMKVWIFSQNDLGRVFDVLMIRRKMIANPTLVVEVGKVRSAFMGKTVPVGGTNIAVGLR